MPLPLAVKGMWCLWLSCLPAVSCQVGLDPFWNEFAVYTQHLPIGNRNLWVPHPEEAGRWPHQVQVLVSDLPWSQSWFEITLAWRWQTLPIPSPLPPPLGSSCKIEQARPETDVWVHRSYPFFAKRKLRPKKELPRVSVSWQQSWKLEPRYPNANSILFWRNHDDSVFRVIHNMCPI